MPTSTGHTLKRVAKVNAMSWDLSPSSATKMTPNARSVLARTASTGRYGLSGPYRDEVREPRPGTLLPGSKVSPAWRTRPHGRTSAGSPASVSVSTATLGATPLRSTDSSRDGAAAHRDERLPAGQPGPASRGSTAGVGACVGSTA